MSRSRFAKTYNIMNVGNKKMLNLFSLGKASNGMNVVLYEADGSDEQKWTFDDSRLFIKTNPSYCLDRFNYLGNSKHNNADIWKESSKEDDNQEIEIIFDDPNFKIRLLKTNLYLTANSGSNGTGSGKTTTSQGNVYWALEKSSAYQLWDFEEIKSSGEDDGVLNMDKMVYKTHKWLNKTYLGRKGYDKLDLRDDSIKGKTGWKTIYALMNAFQIELGITSPANNFGLETTKRFIKKYDNGIYPAGQESTDNIYGIIQGALWCKGYSTGHYPGDFGDLDTHFDDLVANAIKKLKKDAGLLNPDGVITLNVMKALLSMDYFVIGYGTSGKDEIRTIQQELNRNYEDYIGLMPCDGVYGRNTNKALIYALQAEEGLLVDVANGNFGPSTRKLCPTIPYSGKETNYNGNRYSAETIHNITRILQFSLYCNGVGSFGFNGLYNDGTKEDIKEFQRNLVLEVTGSVNLGMWLSLLISCGDKNRPAKAFDCATILTPAKATTLKNAGYEIGGRYLTQIPGGLDKALTKEEIDIIFAAGLRFFPIYQTSANNQSYFTPNQGAIDALSAIYAAYNLQIPENNVIYFAVDFDAMDYQITNNIIPYFKAVFKAISTSKIRKYRVGIYGARNVCTRVSNKGYACNSFVSDMSTGFSGNLGFTIPDNWAFDQFATRTVGSGDGRIQIDKVSYSGRDVGVSSKQAPDTGNAFGFPNGAIINPVTGEIYPIMYYENGKQYSEPDYKLEINTDEQKPTHLGETNFDLAQFVVGFQGEDSLINSKYPIIGGLAGLVIGAINSLNNSLRTIYMDVDYYKVPSTGQKKAVIRCGDSNYIQTFRNWKYEDAKSLKSLYSTLKGDNAWTVRDWRIAIDKIAKEQYRIFKGITPNDEYDYDVECTYDPRRCKDKYVSYIFFGKDGGIYEYAKMYETEKIEIVVTKKIPFGKEEIDRLDITSLLSPVSKLPDDKAELFNILAK